MKTKSVLLLLLLSTLLCQGQSLELSDSLSTRLPITNFSIDAVGNIYLAFEGGQITKYSSTLDSLYSYEPIKTADVTLLEAGNGLYIFAFYDFFQEYLLLNRFLTGAIRTSLPQNLSFTAIATQSQDNNLWILDNVGLRLLKYNAQLKSIVQETTLSPLLRNERHQFTFIKEYQNKLYLVDNLHGIYVFDNLGNYLTTLEASTNQIGFYGANVYYLQNNNLIVQDLYTSQTVKTPLTIPTIKGVLLFKKTIYFITSKRVFFGTYK